MLVPWFGSRVIFGKKKKNKQNIQAFYCFQQIRDFCVDGLFDENSYVIMS